MLCASAPHVQHARRRETSAADVPATRHDVDVTLLTCSVDSETAAAGTVDFPALAWRPSPNGDGPRWVVPPLVEVVDYLEEEGFTAIHTDSSAGQGLVALAAARLLHLPVTGAVDPDGLEAPRGPGDIAGRLRRRYSVWFYGKLDEAYAPTRAAARALVAAGVEPSRITASAGVVRARRRRRAGPEPGRAAPGSPSRAGASCQLRVCSASA